MDMRNLMDFFRPQTPNSAALAKERLQIIIKHERHSRHSPDYLPALKRELLEVVRKYVAIEPDQIQVNLQRHDDCDILKLDITLPDGA